MKQELEKFTVKLGYSLKEMKMNILLHALKDFPARFTKCRSQLPVKSNISYLFNKYFLHERVTLEIVILAPGS